MTRGKSDAAILHYTNKPRFLSQLLVTNDAFHFKELLKQFFYHIFEISSYSPEFLLCIDK